VQQLTEQQVRNWMQSIFAQEGPEDGEHSLSPTARYVTLALAGMRYLVPHSPLKRMTRDPELRKFRSFLDEIVRVMDDCGVRPWTDDDNEKGQ
jgi:hypothetical protein